MSIQTNFRAARALVIAGCWLVFLAAAPFLVSQVDPFYLKAYADGEKAFAAGDFQSAAQSFEIAAFGLREDRSHLTKAWGYLCVAAYKAGQIEKSRGVAQNLEELMGTAGLSGIGLGTEIASDLEKLIKFFKENLQSRGASAGGQTKVLPSAQASKAGTGTPEDKIALEREQSLDKAVKADPKNASLYLDLYEFYLIQKKSKEAKAILEKLVDRVPEEPQGHYLLGKTLYAGRRYKDALKHFQTVLRLMAKKPVEGSLVPTSRGYVILCQNALNRKKDVALLCAEYRQAVPDGSTGALDMPEKDKDQLTSILTQNQISPAEETTPAEEKKVSSESAPAAKAAPSPAQPAAEAGGTSVADSTKDQPPKEVALAYGVYDQYLQENKRDAARRTLQSLLRKYPQELRASFLLAKMAYQEQNYREAEGGFRAVLEAAGSAGSGEGFRAEAAAYLILCAQALRSREAALSLAQTYRGLLSGPALDGLSLNGSEKQMVRDLVDARPDSPAQARILRDVLVRKLEDSLRIEVIYSPPGTYRTFVLRGERKIILDLFNVSEVRSERIIPVNSQGLQSIRTGMFEEKTARIVFDLNGEIPAYDIQQTAAGLVVVIGKAPSLPDDLSL